MSRRFIVAACLVVVAGLLAFSTEGQAMPNFARKYNADCTMCHIQIPKLNRLGYEFRAAGFRLPSEIGQEEKAFNLGDFFTARFQEQYTWDQKNPKTGAATTRSQLEFFEFTFYPLTGSWGKYFASLGELSMTPDDVFEVENAYIRGVYGSENGWGQARIGVMHPWEGFGASDRPLGNIRPLFQKNTAIGSPFILWNLDEDAVEAGYHYAKTGTTISARISNGILWKDDGTGAGEPAQGGGLTKPKGSPGENDKDYQVFINQFITNDSAVSAYFYWGVNPFPDPNLTPAPTLARDSFYRIAVYANYFVLPKTLDILGGYEHGHDSLNNSSILFTGTDKNGTAHTFNASQVGESNGYFGELNYHAIPGKLAFGARYDFFDPSDEVIHNSIRAVTATGNWYIGHGFQFVADYQHKETEVSAGGRNMEDQVQARLIFIM